MSELWRARRWIVFAGAIWAVFYSLDSLGVRDWIGAVASAVLVLVLLGYVLSGSRLARKLARAAWRQRRLPRRRTRPLNADLLSILTLSSYGFEIFCRDLLTREGYQAVTTKQTGDHGVDVELRARDGRTGVAQCKQVLNTRIGRPVVQQLYGEMISRRATFGFLITTGTFTNEARIWASTKTVTLVDRDQLLQMVDRQART